MVNLTMDNLIAVAKVTYPTKIHVACLYPNCHLQAIYAGEISYILNVCLIKISILCMYCRIFAVYNFRLAAWIIGTFTVVWAVTFIFASAFQCTPVARVWDPLIPGKCISVRSLAMGNAIPNIVIDFIILTMPVYQIWHLHMRRAQRVTLMGVFLLGGL